MLAIGGAGVTYRAREIDDENNPKGPTLALKVLFAARAEGHYLSRLATEAQIIQELNHPNIVEYLGFVHRAGHPPYLITHFEPGGSLLEYLGSSGPLTVQAAAQVGQQICLALSKAHARGIVHRDLKPENVLLSAKWSQPLHDKVPDVRVADFGIAKVHGSIGSNLTRVGAFIGTPHYAAPEQFAGAAVTEATDVYGVGALLFFCLTGRYVVEFANRLDPTESLDLLLKSLPPQVSSDTHDPAALHQLNQALALAMAAAPDDRCSVRILGELLGKIAQGEPAFGPQMETTQVSDSGRIPAAPKKTAKPTQQRLLFVAVILIALLFVGGVGITAVMFLANSQDVPSPNITINATLLEKDSPTPLQRQDWSAIRASVDGLLPWLARQCEVPDSYSGTANMIVDTDGTVLFCEVQNNNQESLERCIETSLSRARYTRTGDTPVRVTMELQW